MFASSHRRCSIEKAVLNISQYSLENALKTSFIKCFPMNIAKFLRKPIYSEEEVQMAASECFHFRWLLNDVNLFFL